MSDIITFEPTRTNVAASPIPIPLNTARDVASVGHIPKSSLNVGFSLTNPLVKLDINFKIITSVQLKRSTF